MADSKLIAFAVVGLLVGAAIGVGIGFAVFNKNTDDNETYYFYIDFGASDAKTGWYSAKAANADEALEKAVDGKDITLKWSDWGYPNFSESGSWATYNYTWSDFSKKAADNSTKGVVNDTYSYFAKSNGWNAYSGFNTTDEGKDHKLWESDSTTFYFSPYSALRTPIDNLDWKTASGTPFATA